MIYSMESDIESLIVEESGVRLDRWLADRIPGVSRTTFQRWICEGHVTLEGQPVKKRTIPECGDHIEVHFQIHPELSLTPESIPLDILFEDEEILVLNKEAGRVVHPGAGHSSGTLVHGLLYHCHHLPDPSSLRPGLVHRLDKDTSGVLIVAKTERSLRALQSQFAHRTVKKRYLALVYGKPEATESHEPIGRDPRHRQKMAVSSLGRSAHTSWTSLSFSKGLSLLEVTLHTGRTHQIRVHLSHIGHPIFGDPLYGGGRSSELKRQWLHAYSLQILHPISQAMCEFIAPVPKELKSSLPIGINHTILDR